MRWASRLVVVLVVVLLFPEAASPSAPAAFSPLALLHHTHPRIFLPPREAAGQPPQAAGDSSAQRDAVLAPPARPLPPRTHPAAWAAHAPGAVLLPLLGVGCEGRMPARGVELSCYSSCTNRLRSSFGPCTTPTPSSSPTTTFPTPLTQRQDMDPASFVRRERPWWERVLGLPAQRVGLMAQGLQRTLDGAGRVQALRQPSGQLVDALGPSTLVFLSGERRQKGKGMAWQAALVCLS